MTFNAFSMLRHPPSIRHAPSLKWDRSDLIEGGSSFPKIKGLGLSPTAQRFAISSLDEGAAYLEHRVLGRGSKHVPRWSLRFQGKSVHDIFGYPDDLKFHSSITLFAELAEKLSFRLPSSSKP